jgi:phage terminase Nu1 subunit (DNA packaging protein)
MVDQVDVTKPLWFSASQLAKLWGVSVQRIDQLNSEGTLIKVERRYDLHVNMPLYLNRLRKQASGRMGGSIDGEDAEGGTPLPGLDPVQEGARLKKEQADAVALKNEVARGNLVPRDAIEKAFGGVIIAAKSRLETLSTRLPRMIHGLTKRDQQIIATDVRTTLDQLVIDGAKALKSIQGQALEDDESDVD